MQFLHVSIAIGDGPTKMLMSPVSGHGSVMGAEIKVIWRVLKCWGLEQRGVGPHCSMGAWHEGGLGMEVAPVGACRPGARETTTQNGAMSKV